MRLTILATLVTLTALSPAAVAQTRFTVVPTLSIAGIYDDNIFAETEGSAGRMLQLRPTFEGHWESPRLSFISLYSQDMLRSNFSSLNTFDARRHAFLDTKFLKSPLTTLGITGRYDRSETPGEIDLSGILGSRQTAQRWQLSPTVVRRISPRSVVTAGYDFTRENELDTPSGMLHQARFALSREFSSRSALVGTYLARYFVDPSDRSTSHSVLGGWTREMAPHTHLSVYAGPRVTSYRSGIKPEVSASLRRDTTRIDMRMDYWHGETIILGIPGASCGPSVIAGSSARTSARQISTRSTFAKRVCIAPPFSRRGIPVGCTASPRRTAWTTNRAIFAAIWTTTCCGTCFA
jgi:hypothetical protein